MRNATSIDKIETCFTLWISGSSTAKIAKKLKCNRNTVTSWIKIFNFEDRKVKIYEQIRHNRDEVIICEIDANLTSLNELQKQIEPLIQKMKFIPQENIALLKIYLRILEVKTDISLKIDARQVLINELFDVFRQDREPGLLNYIENHKEKIREWVAGHTKAKNPR